MVMRPRIRSAAVLLFLVLWVLAGPIASTFGCCDAMCAMCEGPCGAGPCVVFTPMLSVLTVPVIARVGPLATSMQLLGLALPLPEVPPKSLFLSA